MAGEQTVTISSATNTTVKVVVNAIGSSGSHVALVVDTTTTRLDGRSTVPTVYYPTGSTGIAEISFSVLSSSLNEFTTLICKVNGTADSVAFSEYAIPVKVLQSEENSNTNVAASVWGETASNYNPSNAPFYANSFGARLLESAETYLSNIGLDHLVANAVTGSDVANNSIAARLVSKSATADWDSYNNTTDSLEAISDSAFNPATTSVEVGSLSLDGQTAIEAEVEDALVAIGLDHLIHAPVSGTDVTDNSIIAKLVSKETTADWDDYANTTDSLQAIRDQGDTAWTTATGFNTTTPPTVNAIADAVWDELQAGHTTTGSFGEYLDAAISSISGGGGTSITAQDIADIADAVWDEQMNNHSNGGTGGYWLTQAGTAGLKLNSMIANIPNTGNYEFTLSGVGKIADAVWTENLADHSGTAGSTAEALDESRAERVWDYATRTITSGGISASEVTSAVWGADVDSNVTAGSYGVAFKKIKEGYFGIDGAVNDTSATSSVFETNLASTTNDFYNDCIIEFTSGSLAGERRVIDDYNGTTKEVTLDSALSSAPSNQDKFVVVQTIADMVWDENISHVNHTQSNSAGERLRLAATYSDGANVRLSYLTQWDSQNSRWEINPTAFNATYGTLFNDPSSDEIYTYFTATVDDQGNTLTNPRADAFKANVSNITTTVGAGDIISIADAVWDKDISGYTDVNAAGYHLLDLDNASEIYTYFTDSVTANGVTTQREDVFKASAADIYNYFTDSVTLNGVTTQRQVTFRATDTEIKAAVLGAEVTTGVTVSQHLSGIKAKTDNLQFTEPTTGTFLLNANAEQFDEAVYAGMYTHFTFSDSNNNIDRAAAFKDSADITAIKAQTDKLSFTETAPSSGVFNVNANAAVSINQTDAATIYDYFIGSYTDQAGDTIQREDAFKADISGLATNTALNTVDGIVDDIKVVTDKIAFTNVLDENGAIVGYKVNSNAPTALDVYEYFTDASREDVFKQSIPAIYNYFIDTVTDSNGVETVRPDAFKASAADFYSYFTATQDGAGNALNPPRADAFKDGVTDASIYNYFTGDADDGNGGTTPRELPFRNTAGEIRGAVGLSNSDLDTQLSNIPTTTEFTARTIPTDDYFNPSTDTVDIGKVFGDAGSAESLKDSAKQMTRCTVTNQSTPATAGGRSSFSSASVTTAAADHFVGRLILFTSGTLEGQASDIVDYELSNGVGLFSVTELTSDPSVNDTFIIV
jgi:hypothetical protein